MRQVVVFYQVMSNQGDNTAKCRRWRNSHREQVRKYGREYQQKYRVIYNQQNPEKVKAWRQRYYYANLEKMRLYNRIKKRQYRARKNLN